MFAAALFGAAPAMAQAPLAYTDAGTLIGRVNPRLTFDEIYDLAREFHRNGDVDLARSVPDAGSIRVQATTGISAGVAVPVLRARAEVIGANDGLFGFVQGLQGYRNIGSDALELGFSGLIDYTASGGPRYVQAGISVFRAVSLTPGTLQTWLPIAPYGQSLQSCATPGALAVVDAPFTQLGGAQTIAIDTAANTCGGGSLFSILPGETFYVLARMQIGLGYPGTVDAFNTFQVAFSDLIDPDTRGMLAQVLQPVGANGVPEPATWALLVLAFGMIGAALRHRRGSMPAFG